MAARATTATLRGAFAAGRERGAVSPATWPTQAGAWLPRRGARAWRVSLAGALTARAAGRADADEETADDDRAGRLAAMLTSWVGKRNSCDARESMRARNRAPDSGDRDRRRAGRAIPWMRFRVASRAGSGCAPRAHCAKPAQSSAPCAGQQFAEFGPSDGATQPGRGATTRCASDSSSVQRCQVGRPRNASMPTIRHSGVCGPLGAQFTSASARCRTARRGGPRGRRRRSPAGPRRRRARVPDVARHRRAAARGAADRRPAPVALRCSRTACMISKAVRR